MRGTTMSRLFAVILLLLLLGTAIAEGGTPERLPASPGYFLVVNIHNPVSSLDRKFVADTFFKRVTRWPENGTILPVDQLPGAIARRRFSEEILNRSVSGIKGYWQQIIFSGVNVPPPELPGDAEVLKYVAKFAGSIGYVSAAAMAGSSSGLDGVKTVEVR
jgi:ABC-type phosphate transport system substrate-binding protein